MGQQVLGLLEGQPIGVPGLAIQAQRTRHRLHSDRPVGQQRRHVHGVVARVDARVGPVAWVAIRRELLGRELRLGLAWLHPLTMGQDHRPDRCGDQQGRGDLEGEKVPGEEQHADALDIAFVLGVGLGQAGDRGAVQRADDPGQQQAQEAHEGHPGQHALALERLHEAVGGIHTHDHQHEDEQHHHRAGVDDDLHHAQEWRVLGHVEDRQVDHRHGDEQGAVHSLAGQDGAQGADHSECGAHPERDGLAGVRLQADRTGGGQGADRLQCAHCSSVPEASSAACA